MVKKVKSKKPKTAAGKKKLVRTRAQADQASVPLLETVQNVHALLRQRRKHEAEKLFLRLLHTPSRDPVFFDQLGILAHILGKSDIGIDLLQQSIQLLPSAPSFNNLGLILAQLGNMDAAQTYYTQALKVDSNFATAHFNLGNVLLQKLQFETAIEHYQQAVCLKPDYVAAYSNLAKTQKKLGCLEEAEKSCVKALMTDPSHGETIQTWRTIILLREDPGHILEICERAFGPLGNKFPIYFEIGNVLSSHGLHDEAKKAYRKSLEGSDKPGMSHYRLSRLKKYHPQDSDISEMERIYASFSDPVNRGFMSFALGKVYEDIGNFSQAFKCLSEGNRLVRSTYSYSTKKDEEFFESMKSLFGSHFLRQSKDIGLRDSTPIFIVGMPRSGTTLVEQILASHSQVFGAGELYAFDRVVRNTLKQKGICQFPEGIRKLKPDALQYIGDQYISCLRSYDKNAPKIVDKKPQNFLWVGLIQMVLPCAQIIHCKRDPMDTCWSIYKNVFDHPLDYAQDLTELGHYYKLYLDIMDHWKRILPGKIYEIEYEKLIQDQENETRKLLEHCNLIWETACLNFHKMERQVHTSSMVQVRTPIYSSSVKKWENFEQELKILVDIVNTP